jgi:iron complex outermembrane receptor protein
MNGPGAFRARPAVLPAVCPPSPPPRPVPPRRPLAPLLAALLLGAAAPGHAAEDDLTSLSLEALVETEVLSAAHFARQITDAASAVSVLSARDIRAQGLRTLAEVLDQMRGLHISTDYAYAYLGARAFGGPRTLAGRVLLLVDGIPAVDNLYDQMFLGQDSVLDPALIERIEYTPGGSSASYGNNAFLGVVNIVTLRGRDLQGWQWSAAHSTAQRLRQVRLSGGQRDASGLEWLASVTAGRHDGLPDADNGRSLWPDQGRSLQWLLKGQWGDGWQAQWMGMAHTVASRVAPDYRSQFLDGNQFLSIGRDQRPAPGWRTSWRLQGGYHRYFYDFSDTGYRNQGDLRGRWHALEGQAIWEGWTDQTWSLGLRWRQDPWLQSRSRFQGDPQQPAQEDLVRDQRGSRGLSLEDRLRLRDDLHLTLGLRLDRHDGGDWTPNLRHALVWAPAPQWQLKWSDGLSSRFASAAEEGWGRNPQPRPERVRSHELGTEYRDHGLRALATAYQYRMTRLLLAPPDLLALQGRGLELEGEWQDRGWRLRGSHAWQQLEDDRGRRQDWSPARLSKLSATAPLDGERWQLSLGLRHHSGVSLGPQEQTGDRTRVDLTLVGNRFLGALDLRLGVRNVGAVRLPAFSVGPNPDDSFTRPARVAWVELSGHW